MITIGAGGGEGMLVIFDGLLVITNIIRITDLHFFGEGDILLVIFLYTC